MSKPNVIWWSIDSVRRDRCSAYGYHRQTTPNLSNVGVQLPGRSHGTWTLPSTTSMLTLRGVNDHGITKQGDRLKPESETVPKRFRSAGYRTVGLAANPWVSRSSGLDIGFDEFYNIDEDRSLLREVGWKSALKFAAGIRSRGGGLTTQAVKHPSDWLMISLAKQKLSKIATADSSTFMYLHTKGVHKVDDDFYPPPAWKGRITPNENFDDRYDDLLAWVDNQWPRLESAIDDDTIVVVTSDHGELLGEDGHIGHNYDHPLLYEVPLWIRGIETDQFDGETSHIDAMSAVLSAVGLSSKPCDISPVTGRSRDLVEQAERKLSSLGYK